MKKLSIGLNMPAIEEKTAAPAAGTQLAPDPLVQRLTEWENTPKGSPERLQVFKKVIETLYNEHAE